MTKIINATPHDVIIMKEDGTMVKSYPVSGIVLRVSFTEERIGTIDGVDCYKAVYSKTVEGLPEPEEGTYYIVSLLAKNAADWRNDLLIPFGTVRDEKGRIIGCKGFA